MTANDTVERFKSTYGDECYEDAQSIFAHHDSLPGDGDFEHFLLDWMSLGRPDAVVLTKRNCDRRAANLIDEMLLGMKMGLTNEQIWSLEHARKVLRDLVVSQ